MGIPLQVDSREKRSNKNMLNVSTIVKKKEGTVSFSAIERWKFFSVQPEGFILQKVSAIHFLPVSVRCKYRAMLMDQGEEVYPRNRFA